MSVELTDRGFKFEPIQATNPTLPDNKYKPNKVMHEWQFSAQGVGDGSGGIVYTSIPFGTYFDKNHFIMITNIFPTWGSTSMSTYLETDTDRWDNLYHPGHADEDIKIWRALAQTHCPLHSDMLKKPIYMGRPRQQDGDAGSMLFNWLTNTNSELYNLVLLGYTLERPLPFTSIFQP